MNPANKFMKEGLVLEVHWYIPYWREKGLVGSRPVCALLEAKQDGATAADNGIPLPERLPVPDTASRRAATQKGRLSQAGLIIVAPRLSRLGY